MEDEGGDTEAKIQGGKKRGGIWKTRAGDTETSRCIDPTSPRAAAAA